MIQNKYALPLSVKAFWRGDNDSTEETVTMPCDKDDTPDFYLLCDANDLTVSGDWADGTENAYYALADIRDRTNALSGIPTESLGEVKKAMIAYQFMRDECDKQVSVAIEQRKEGDDFGKLINALIDSVNKS